jgi:predicted metal-binding protein
MPDYDAHVLVCTNSEDAEDRRHCGDKAGSALRQRFNELLVKHELIEKVTINDVGCTSQHRACATDQGTVIVYGPGAASGGTWYIASTDDVDEIITEHLIKGQIVDRLQNKERAVKLS